MNLLLVEDNEGDALQAVRSLESAGLSPTWKRVSDGSQFEEALGAREWDAVLSAYVLADFSGPRALARLRELDPILPFVVVSGKIGEQTAVDMLRQGANDYVSKDRLERLPRVLERALEEARHLREQRAAEEHLTRRSRQLECLYFLASRLSQAQDIVEPLAGQVAAALQAAHVEFLELSQGIWLSRSSTSWPDQVRETSLAQKVLETGNAHLSRDSFSLVAVPVPFAHDRAGVLVARDERPEQFEQDDISFLESVGRLLQSYQTALINREELSRRQILTEAETEVLRALGLASTLPRLFSGCVEALERTLPCRVGIWQIGPLGPVLSTGTGDEALALATAELGRVHVGPRFIGCPLGNGFVLGVSCTTPCSYAVSTVSRIATALGESVARLVAEEASRESHDRLHRVVESTDDGFWDWHVTSGKVYYSWRCARMLGFEPDAMEHSLEAFQKLLHPEDAPRVMELVGRHLVGEVPAIDTEFRMLTADGEWKWILARGRVSSWLAPGQPEWVTGTHRDVDEDRRARDLVEESRQRLQLLVEHSPLGVLECDPDGKVTTWNPSAQAIFGWAPEEIIGRHWRRFAPATPELEALWKELTEGTGGFHSVNCNRTRDGREIQCEWFNTRLVSSTGRLLGTASLFADVTAARETERQLTKLWRAVEQSPLAVIITDAEGVVEYVNPFFESLTGYSAAEVFGRKPSVLKSGRGQSRLSASSSRGRCELGGFSQFLEGPSAQTQGMRNRRPGGARRFKRASLRVTTSSATRTIRAS